jgi:cyclase
MGAPTSHDHHEHGDHLPPPRVEEVADGVFAYVQPDGSWWINNTGFLTGRDHTVAIDTCSTERRTRALLEAIGGVTDRAVRTLVNTHHHGDHTNGNSLVPEATIIGHTRCREEMARSPIGAAGAVFGGIEWGDVELRPPTVTFDSRLDVHVDERRVELHFIGAPAHTVGDIVAWLPEDGVLFAGDLVFNGGTPFVLMGSVAGSLAALDRLAGFGARTIVPGHGGVCGPSALDDVRGYLRFVTDLAAEAKAAGVEPLEAARQADLGGYADLLDVERIVGNLHRAYAELDGGEWGEPLDLARVFGDMIAFNGGKPLRCFA